MNLFILFGTFFINDALQLFYLVTQSNYQGSLRLYSISIMILNFISSPILLILISAYKTELNSFTYSIRICLFFPISLVLCNAYLALHPSAMQFLMCFVGVRDIRDVIKCLKGVYYAKMCIFISFELVVEGITVILSLKSSQTFDTISKIYLCSFLTVTILLILISYFGISKHYGTYITDFSYRISYFDNFNSQYESLAEESVGNRHSILTLKFKVIEENDEVCAICLDRLKVGDGVLEINSCKHEFHDICLEE